MNLTPEYYATECHKATNHYYGNGAYKLPYAAHLKTVVAFATKYIHLIPEEAREDVISACWCHDLIEDTRQTCNDVKQATNERVADIVYALTNEKGKNRKERANDKYYYGISRTPYAAFVKICDRLANVAYSKETNSSMFEMYRKENAEFVKALWLPLYASMFKTLNDMFL